eukprot:CAMPEP_0201545144 /NCGR_PEP_ID=MMETSP0173_2-20130828/1685_1 /ASSEMBLY_ACC=CAM_ASM_000268 /TAXON_ID=218659 /ORGANISM="Vexillifera sp., Strain DIVA3 564/2" /LENGTH=209 /DNA_ID=CAMNT_0047953465 /DNA_START=338 /DNA_END=967 /DNA_ORIENTATION=+
MMACFGIGTLLPVIEFLTSLGLQGAADYVSTFDNIPNAGIQALEVSYVLSLGRSAWIFSTQFIFLSCGLFVSAFLSLRRIDIFPRNIAIIAVSIGTLGLISFGLEIGAYYSVGVKIAAGVIVLAWGVFLLPVWMIYMGWCLSRSYQEIQEEQNLDMRDSQSLAANRATHAHGYGQQIDDDDVRLTIQSSSQRDAMATQSSSSSGEDIPL